MLQILVIDDESVTRRLVTFALKPLNIEVLSAENATNGLNIANQHEISLVLVDVNLPDMDGFKLIQEFRKIPHMGRIPIVSFTARNDPEDAMRAQQVGAIDLLYKPFSMQELRDIVTKYAAL